MGNIIKSPLFRHTCDSAKINRVAYDADAKRLYLEFKPKMSVYVYAGVDASHFAYIANVKAIHAAHLEDPEVVAPMDTPEGVTPGSEGSYIIRVIVGTDSMNPPFPFRRLDDVEAAEIFPYQPAEAA